MFIALYIIGIICQFLLASKLSANLHEKIKISLYSREDHEFFIHALAFLSIVWPLCLFIYLGLKLCEKVFAIIDKGWLLFKNLIHWTSGLWKKKSTEKTVDESKSTYRNIKLT